MTDTPLAGLIVRTAAVRRQGLGYIYAADPKKEAEEVPHAITFRVNDGVFTRGEANYDAHSIALITKPDLGLVAVSGAGYYSAILATGTSTGDIFDDSEPRPSTPRTGGIRSVAEIGGKAYAVGLRGMVYRFERKKRWSRIDDGLPDTFNAQSIHGVSDDDIYAAGREGALWQFDGAVWARRDLATSVTLTAVKVTPSGVAYLGGHRGVLFKGSGSSWSALDHGATEDDIWDIEWFADRLFVSTMRNVYVLRGETLEPVDFGGDKPKSCYQLSVGENVMWSNGEFDVMSYDGTSWTRIV